MRSTGSPGGERAILVEMGDYRLVRDPERLTCVGLGSCVAIVLHDSQGELGAVAHVMLPFADGNKSRIFLPGKFADSAVQIMTKEMERLGAPRRRIEAKLFGGANMFPSIPSSAPDSIGDRNVRVAKHELKKWGIRIVAEDTGGHVGRTIVFDPWDGSVRVRHAGGVERIH